MPAKVEASKTARFLVPPRTVQKAESSASEWPQAPVHADKAESLRYTDKVIGHRLFPNGLDGHVAFRP